MFKFFSRKSKEQPQNISIKSDEDKLRELFNSFVAATNISVTQRNALQVSAVFSCVNVIAGSLSMLPLTVHRKVNGVKLDVSASRIPLAYALKHEAFPGVPSQSVIFAILANLVLRSNAYAFVGRNGVGQPVSLTPLETQYVKWEEREQQYIYTTETRQIRYLPSQLLHIRGFTMTGGLGIDMLGMAHEAIGLAIALDTNAAKFFANNCRIGTTFETEKHLSPEARKAFEEKLRDKFEGPENAHRHMILEAGLKMSQNRASNTDAQMDEFRRHQLTEIARFFGVPPHKIGVLNNIPRANAEEANIAFITDTLSKYATLVESAINVQLLGRQLILDGYYAKFNLGALLRGTLLQRYQSYAIGRQWGWLSANDIRILEDMDPIENGDRYLEPVNMVEAGKQLEESIAANEPRKEEEPEARFTLAD